MQQTRMSAVFYLLLAILLAGTATAATAQQKDPFSGWGKAGSNPAHYQTGFLEKAQPQDRQLGFVKSVKNNRKGFGTLMRTASTTGIAGKRIQLTTFLKTDKAGSAAAWFRVNGERKTLAFDNMINRRIKGTVDWQMVTLVLDIDEDADSVSYGVMLEGKGQVWFAEPTFQVVDDTIATTGMTPAQRKRLDTLHLQDQQGRYRSYTESAAANAARHSGGNSGSPARTTTRQSKKGNGQ